ncbi:MAG: hypothetical protein A2657_01520 [Candidatus Yanofskybacteria bacterium RIFCSPHIGHO2_01_FULL_44_110b]|nr:MAG: hypothetical protein A2657_01520 [Candidatus Yanofskybacteria bacterium RIFCSPHIGHO2_01_FULL_44_110b]
MSSLDLVVQVLRKCTHIIIKIRQKVNSEKKTIIARIKVMEISEAALATIAYYDALDYPVSLFEVYRYLVNPSRLKPRIEGLAAANLKDIRAGLGELLEKEAIEEERGFYFLKGKRDLVSKRLKSEKIAAQKWRRCLNKAYWLQAAPWVRGIFASGSLALGSVDEDSDFDVLVIIESGRLYLGRLILSVLASLLGARRTRFQTKAPDKFCFNHYLTTVSSSNSDTVGRRGPTLEIEHQSLYNAQTYVHLVPIMIDPRLIGKFFAANLWINKYVYNFTPHYQTIRRTAAKNSFLIFTAKLVEKILAGNMGDLFENLARSYQQKRIVRNPATHAPGGRVVYTDHELEFHPYSFEKTVLEKYNAATRRLGISINTEHDSGLKI